MTAPLSEPWVDVFEVARPRLLGLAYRMLGTLDDAEDIVQEAFLRWLSADHDAIVNPDAWLTTVASRLALDRLRAQQRRREDYVGPWVAEPLVLEPGPEETAVRTESLTLGFLALLDRLAPVERAVFLLADVFGVPFAEIAETVGRSPAACRQIASRARSRVRSAAPRFAASPDRRVVEEFLVAVALGDIDAVLARLSPEAVCVSDGGANKRAARRPVVGADRVARFFVNLARRYGAEASFASATINGCAGLIVSMGGGIELAAAFEVADGRVRSIWVVRNPDKLVHLVDAVPIS
ncbi:MAG TPA: RNA polymerase sigma factor SigJ [Acidimicrobiales bacterium]|nr:RNA polymerase sigma factor SigJ [Acidimicrobiales bacterium]